MLAARGSIWRNIEELLTAGRAAYTELKNLCLWAKDNGGMGSLYRSQHELVFVFKNGEVAHRNNNPAHAKQTAMLKRGRPQ